MPSAVLNAWWTGWKTVETARLLSRSSPVTVNTPCAAENVAVTAGRTRRSSSSRPVSSARETRRDRRWRRSQSTNRLTNLRMDMVQILQGQGVLTAGTSGREAHHSGDGDHGRSPPLRRRSAGPAAPPYDVAAPNTSDQSSCVGGESGPRATIAPGLSPEQAAAQVSHWVEGSDVPTGRGWAACARIRTSQRRPALEFE